MDTLAQSSVEPDLQLLTDWGDQGASGRWRKALVAAVLLHVALITLLSLVPAGGPPPEIAERAPIITPLIEPPTELTQKAPNRAKVMAEFQVTASVPQPRLETPVERPAAPHPKPRPAVMPQAPPPKPTAQITLPDAPKIETPVKDPKTEQPKLSPMPPPAPPMVQPEKPRIALEDVGGPKAAPAPGQGLVPMPNPSVAAAIHDVARGTGVGGQVTIGDPGAFDENIFGGIKQPSAPTIQGAGLELKSDPMGVDFRNYLSLVLATVRQNWMAVIPESVHLGLRGRVAIQFSIGRDGTVLKLVYAQTSGSRPLDEAAVAGISASNPFLPLPAAFKGDRIVVQLNFAYNMPRR